MRIIKQQTPVNNGIVVAAADEPGPGGANHVYEISSDSGDFATFVVSFQNGGIKEVGVNGIQMETLMSIVCDRLESFQRGPYPCVENERALAHFYAGLALLNQRTALRISRGVEGQQTA